MRILVKKSIFCIFLLFFFLSSAVFAQSDFKIAQVIYVGNGSNQEFLDIAANSDQLRAEFLEGLHSVNINANLQTWFLIYPNERDEEARSVVADVVNNSMPGDARVGDIYIVQVDKNIRRGQSADGWIIYLRNTGNNSWDNIMYYFYFTI